MVHPPQSVISRVFLCAYVQRMFNNTIRPETGPERLGQVGLSLEQECNAMHNARVLFIAVHPFPTRPKVDGARNFHQSWPEHLSANSLSVSLPGQKTPDPTICRFN
eukprot:1188388-Prorocentrum_minimum.AAC.3